MDRELQVIWIALEQLDDGLTYPVLGPEFVPASKREHVHATLPPLLPGLPLQAVARLVGYFPLPFCGTRGPLMGDPHALHFVTGLASCHNLARGLP